MQDFFEYIKSRNMNEANRPEAVLAQRPNFNGVSPDSIEQLFKKTKEIGDMITQYIRYAQNSQPQLAAALGEFQKYLKASAPIVGKIRQAVQPQQQQPQGQPQQQQPLNQSPQGRVYNRPYTGM